MLNCIKIPRDIIYDTNLNDKRVLIFSYLCARRSLDDTVAFSTKELCSWSHMKPNYRDGKINQQYYSVLYHLSEYGYFDEYPDFETLLQERSNSDRYRYVQLNNEFFSPTHNFGLIFLDELQKILNFKEELKDSDVDLQRITSAHLLLVLSYIRVNMNYSSDKPLACYRNYTSISADINISDRYISKSIIILDALQIIKHQKLKRLHYAEKSICKFLTTPTIFVDYRKFKKSESGEFVVDESYDCEFEIEKQLEFMKQSS